MTRYRILFVDDEPQLLRALRSVLRREHGRWDMVFVESGHLALEELGRGPFDLVVSDMRMPDINGLDLLDAVRRDSPRTVRLMLSGTADLDEAEEARSVAHELLGKPCATATLRETIERWLASTSTSTALAS